MQPDIRPSYGPVAFRDRSTGHFVVTRSTLTGRASQTDQASQADQAGRPTVEVGGRTYPVVDVDVTSDSHPFWTGKARTLDSEGRVETFQRRYGRS